MRTVRLTLGLALLLGLITFVVAAVPARAAVSITVTPALVELEAKPGGEGTQAVTIANGGDGPLDLAVAVEAYKSATGDQSAIAWLTVQPAALRIEPGRQGTVTVTIKVPSGLTSGGRYAAVTFTTGAKPGTAGAAMAGKVGVPFMVAVKGKGKLTKKVEIERFAPLMTPDGRIAFAAMVRNAGNLHVRPAGGIELLRGDGSSLGTLAFQAAPAVLPGSSVTLSTQSSVPLDARAGYRATAVIDYGAKKPLKRDVDFTPVPSLVVAGASVCENLDRGPTLSVSLHNGGELALQPHVAFAIRDANGNPLGSVSPTQPLLVWPGEDGGASVDLAERLASGPYVLSLRIDAAMPDPEGRTAVPPIETDVPFQIGGLGGNGVPLCATS
jgi:P pilus assembly chaperone PapD